MPSDYDQIRAENISRYGWDTAVLEMLGQLYSDRTHFIFELIQNAEDAGATELTFELFGDRLEVRHDGRPFTEADVRGICGVSQGTKADDVTQIGKFGIGFKSVYAYTNTPRISSGTENFRIENYVRPHAHDPLAGSPAETIFVFPFDRPQVPAGIASAEISAALRGLDAQILLFLRGIERIRTCGTGLPDAILERAGAEPGPGQGRRIIVSTRRDQRADRAEWLVWSRKLGESGELGDASLDVEIAFSMVTELDGRRLASRDHEPLVAFFPTQKETFLGFVIQGPYRTTPARDNVPEHDPWNQSLVRQTASLLGDVLTDLRDDGLLTADVLRALPLEAAAFPAGGMFRPLFEAVRAAIGHGQFIPDAEGGYGDPAGMRLARETGLRELLTPDQLGELCGQAGPDGQAGPVRFVHESVSEDETPRLWRYLRDEAGVAQVTPQTVVAALTSEFLTAQPDQWIARLYGFLDRHPSLWREPAAGDGPGPARAKPIIRLRDGSHIVPFDGRGRPAAYLPGPVRTELPDGAPGHRGGSGWPPVPRGARLCRA